MADDIHQWLSFDHEDETYMFDLTFLGSNWSCIYGQGCPGIDEEAAPEREIGCCLHGAHFVDKADRKETKKYAALLGDDEWQFKALAEELGGPIFKNEDGDWVTRVVDGGCIFQNRPGFANGAGCAFHQAAMSRGESIVDWKPTVCWQAPLRQDYHTDDNEHLTHILREWKRRDWGPGGEDFHWWCTDDPAGFEGAATVYETMRDEIVAMVGQEPYDRLVEHFATGPNEQLLPHPALKPRSQGSRHPR
jgi:hypothetical protein